MYRFALLVVFVTLLTSSIAQAASYKKTDGTVVDPIMNTFGNPHGYSGNNLEPNANLTDAYLIYANLSSATFSPGTTLYDGQTVAQHGFDAASLEAYLKASPVSANSANNLTLVPEPASMFLTGLLTLARVRF